PVPTTNQAPLGRYLVGRDGGAGRWPDGIGYDGGGVVTRTTLPDFPVPRPVWQTWRLSPARSVPLTRSLQCPSRTPLLVPTRSADPHHTQLSRRHHNRGRQDPFEAPGQGPGAAVPHRRRRLAQEARRPGDRGDRQVPPQGEPVVHRRRLRPGRVLA